MISQSQIQVKRRAVIDLVAVTVLIGSYIWIWRGSVAGDKLLLAVSMISLAIYVHWSRRESFLQVIAGEGTFYPALRLTAVWAALPLLVILTIALFIERPPLPSWSTMELRLLVFVGIGILQQYLLLAHVWRSTNDLVSVHFAAMLLTAGLFSLFHLPNPFLMIFTAAAGFVAVLIYRRAPNIIVIGVVHGVLSWALYYGLPRSITDGLRIGPSGL